jgi:hypothetical protein
LAVTWGFALDNNRKGVKGNAGWISGRKNGLESLSIYGRKCGGLT